MSQRKWQLCANYYEAGSLQGVNYSSAINDVAGHATSDANNSGGLKSGFFRPAGTVASAKNNFLHDGTTTERTFARLMLKGSVRLLTFCQWKMH